ncbi:hypothetical protein JCM10213_004969 [Rhodosporidiobolus nylandii]
MIEPRNRRSQFRSLPYASPPAVLFPQTPLHVTHTSASFTLRAFPSPRSPNGGASKRIKSPESRTHRPTPPPSLLASTGMGEQPLLTPSAHHARLAALKHRHKPYTLSLTLFVSKKKVHKSAVVRERCKRRVREAVRLVVARGARAEEEQEGEGEGGKRVRLRERKDGGEWETGPGRWLLPGYHYILSLSSLEAYRMPLPDLVDEVRNALQAVRDKALRARLTRSLASIQLDPPTSSASLPPESAPAAPTLEEVRVREAREDELETDKTRRVDRGQQVSWEGTAL